MPKPKRARRPRPGQPPHVPDEKSRRRVVAWSGGGIDQKMIAMSLGISDPTLRKHYRVELLSGKAMMDGLAVSALAMAMQRGGKESVVAAKWWTQSRMGWTEKVLVDDARLDRPMRVIVELVGDPPPAPAETQRLATRPPLNPGLVKLVG